MGFEKNMHNGNQMGTQKSCQDFFQLASKVTVEKNAYVMDIALERISNCNYATSLSSRNIKVFSVEQETCIQNIPAHDQRISRIKFSSEDSCLLYSSSLDGTIRLWDLRTKDSKVQEFTDTTDGLAKAVMSFDYNSDEKYICGGTEVIHEDAFTLFWDRRTSKLLGGYWNSHTDDITQVQFHPNKTNVMATGSLDGLINIYDLFAQTEDDALLHTLNTESSVNKLAWGASKIENLVEVTCLTHVEELQLWNVTEAKHNVSLNRDTLQDVSKVDIDYLVDTFMHEDSTYVVSGNHCGQIQLWHVGSLCNQQNLVTQFSSCHTDDVRSIAWKQKENMLFTGGEDGCVCIYHSSKAISQMKNGKFPHL